MLQVRGKKSNKNNVLPICLLAFFVNCVVSTLAPIVVHHIILRTPIHIIFVADMTVIAVVKIYVQEKEKSPGV